MMKERPANACDVCGAPAIFHCTICGDHAASDHRYCYEHIPTEMRDRLPFGPEATSADQAAVLRRKLATLDEHVSDPAKRTQIRAEFEQLIADVEAGKIRLEDLAC